MNKVMVRFSSCALAGALGVTFAAVANAANLVVNSDFNAGNSEFFSDYGYMEDNLYPEGVYTISKDPSSVHHEWNSFGDHTTGTGNMMIVNGNPEPGPKVWWQTIKVAPNTNYKFSTWIASLFPNSPAELQFAINSELIGQIFTPSTTPGLWGQFNAVWNSGSNESATISIVNQNTVRRGNDFALDDIFFEPISVPEPLPVPESSSNLALVAIGAFGITSLVKRKQQLKGKGSSLS